MDPERQVNEFERNEAKRTAAIVSLLSAIHAKLPDLLKLLAEVEGHWQMEDGFYRFYHQSFKVYRVQELTERMVAAFVDLGADRPLNSWFQQIVKEGTGHTFDLSHNQDWLKHTRPILEAAFHAHYFLKMVCKYGQELKEPPNPMPSGWAAVLYLYNLR